MHFIESLQRYQTNNNISSLDGNSFMFTYTQSREYASIRRNRYNAFVYKSISTFAGANMFRSEKIKQSLFDKSPQLKLDRFENEFRRCENQDWLQREIFFSHIRLNLMIGSSNLELWAIWLKCMNAMTSECCLVSHAKFGREADHLQYTFSKPLQINESINLISIDWSHQFQIEQTDW